MERGPRDRGVGSWVPEQKHFRIRRYLESTRHAWAKWDSRVLIDPFCGPGRIQVQDESFTREGGAVLAWRALANHAPFTQVLIGDLDEARVRAAELRLRAEGAPVQGFVGPADETIHRMVAAVPKSSLCFAYIDPYNLRYLSFSILKALQPLRVDLAINFSTMDLKRNVDFESDPDRSRFDEAAPGWKAHVEGTGTSRSGMSMAFFDYWLNLVKDLGFQHSQEMPMVFNDSKKSIYRIVFFARHKLPTRIWSDIARGPNRELDLFE